MPKTKKNNKTSKKMQSQMLPARVDTQAIIRGIQDGLRVKERKPPSFLDSVGDAMRTFGPAVTGLAKIVGMGDYVVESNTVSTAGTASQSVPVFQSMKGNRIRHKECLGVITGPGSSAYSVLRKINFNPGNTAAFPWLSSFAGNFTGYKVHGAAFVFESNTSEYSAVPYMGTLCIGTRYDTREPDFTSMVEIQNCKYSVSAKPSQNIIHPIECKDGFQPFDSWLIRRGNESNIVYGYDKCNVYVVAEGLQVSTAVLGRLWVTYDIELINPVTPAPNVVNSSQSVMVDTGGDTTLPNVITASTTPLTTLFNNFNGNTSWNARGQGVVGYDLAKSTDPMTLAPFVALYPDGKIRVYKSCTLYINWKITGTSLSASNYVFAANSFPADGSSVTIRRTQGTGNSSTLICESSSVIVRLVNNSFISVPPATNTYYVELEVSNLTGTITNTSASIIVGF